MHVIVWEFTVKAEQAERFVTAYGPGGDWVTLFRRAEGYRETQLLRSTTGEGLRFVTLDRWDSPAAFQSFRERFAKEYARLDDEFAAYTASEEKIGEFTEI